MAGMQEAAWQGRRNWHGSDAGGSVAWMQGAAWQGCRGHHGRDAGDSTVRLLRQVLAQRLQLSESLRPSLNPSQAHQCPKPGQNCPLHPPQPAQLRQHTRTSQGGCTKPPTCPCRNILPSPHTCQGTEWDKHQALALTRPEHRWILQHPGLTSSSRF